MIERNHLAILRATVVQGSLTAAAEKLHISQSALSHSIKKLEQQIGTNLWTKQGRGLQLTKAGEYLLAAANRLLPQLERVDQRVLQYASGERGELRIGMECHPCYQWLLNVVSPFLQQQPGMDIDVKQQFQFGGMAALFNHEIDILVTPDPLHSKGVIFTPVFDYEQVLVVNTEHRLVNKNYVEPEDLALETLLAYPVEPERLDIYSLFLSPAQCRPKRHKTIEATEIMLQMVAAGRGVTALPQWLINEYAEKLPIKGIRLGKQGIAKQIFLGVRSSEQTELSIEQFLHLARKTSLAKSELI